MKYIYGLNKSGRSIINYLDRIGENYFCWDDNKEIRKKLKLSNKNINFDEPNNLNISQINEAFITPGISLKDKRFDILTKNKIKLYRDLELYSRLISSEKIVAITGTNGKSTTTKLISNILSKNNFINFLGGNIGVPLLDFNISKKKKKYHVIELISFQLKSINSFDPLISIILNISPDHLDRYKTYKEYAFQKEKIISSNQKGYNIVSIDHKKTYELYKKYKKKIIPISNRYLANGVYFKDNCIIDNYLKKKNKIKLVKLSPSLFGSFNIENILAAYVVIKILKINISIFKQTLKNFSGLPHRLEKIYANKNLQVINNSKATNVDSSIKSICNFNNINLILGGRAKEKNFKKINIYKNRINKIYIVGESAKLIFKQLNKNTKCEIFDNVEKAMNKILLDIKLKSEFQTILFSPACTSYDQYNNFEERGNFFKKIIKKLIHV